MSEYVGAFRTAAGRESRGGRPALSPARRLLRGDGSATGRLHRSLFGWGFFWLGLGLALEAFEGGIKKVTRRSSIFSSPPAGFVCPDRAGIAMRRLNVRFSALVKCGQNPMVAYTAAGFLIMPLLTLRICRPVCRPLPSYARGWAWRGACWSRPRLWPLRSFLRTAGFFGEPEFEL